MKLFNSIRQYITSTFTPASPYSVHRLSINTLEGEKMQLSRFKGKKMLIVNVASSCGLTQQYEKLQQLYLANVNQLVIIGVPCNDFAAQEPGTPKEIRNFCSTTFNITFPLSEKVNILSEPIHPLYRFLTNKAENNFADSRVEWNFQKYLLDENGVLTHVFSPNVQPDSPEIIKAISE